MNRLKAWFDSVLADDSIYVTLQDVRLWDGTSELFNSLLPVSIVSTGPIVLPPTLECEFDLRIRRGFTRTGIQFMYYHGPEGFKHIILGEQCDPETNSKHT